MSGQDPVLVAVMELKGDVGEVKAQLLALDAWMKQHALDDKEAHARLAQIELREADDRGARRIIHGMFAAVGSIIGSGLTMAVNAFLRWHHP